MSASTREVTGAIRAAAFARYSAPLVSDTDRLTCRSRIRQGSRSFHAASLLLPYSVREPSYALYAFCRLADDAVDLADPDVPGAAAAALARLHQRLDGVFAGEPEDDPADRALADTVERHSIPRAVFDALLEGFAWDVAGRRYETVEDLHGYAARVAATVGVMMTLVMGGRAPEVVARACDLGVAMQLTNIARDVGEDAREGRLYLPLCWLREADVNVDAWLRAPVHTPAIGAVTQRLLDEAARLYQRAESGIACLPGYCRPGIMAARLIYAEIGAEVMRNGLDSTSQRAVVGGRRKLALATKAAQALAAQPVLAASAADSEPLDATRFLVDAVRDARTPRDQPTRRFAVSARLDRVAELFERMEARQRH